ncbi:MAG: helix-turn-helix transcriptional regulator [Ruminococcaceae bacterium]|nr:helix-turn-helix transcriptional regulator [Oscillospiraceae bacterium]
MWMDRRNPLREHDVRRIRQLCRERGFAINMLAKRAGINQSTIDNIVRGLTKNPSCFHYA